MKRLAHAKKRDANEAQIVDLLRKRGATVVLLDKPVDLLIGWRGHNILAEVKTIDGDLSSSQLVFIDAWRGSTIYLLRSTEDATILMNAIKYHHKNTKLIKF